MLKEYIVNNLQNHKEVSKIKFTSDFSIDGVTFIRNSVWDYIDKHEEIVYDDCQECSPFWDIIYRVQTSEGVYRVSGYIVVEVDDVGRYNKDYTKEEWDKKITTDALVKDGDYVSAWRKTYNINKPVKDREDQTDYGSEWKETKKRMDSELNQQTSIS